MTSKLIVNNIEADAGVSTITFGSEISASKITTSSGDFTVGTGASVYSPTTNVLALGTNSAERVRIDSGGRIITGNYSTALDTTAGSIIVNGDTSGGRIAQRGSSTSADASLGELFGFWDTNKVAGIIFSSGSDTTNKDDGTIKFYTSSAGPSVTERLRITSSGNVGIGTDNPGMLLQVYSASSNSRVNIKAASGGTCELQFGDTADEVRGNVIYNCTDDYLSLHGYNNTERLRITSDGYARLTTSNARLEWTASSGSNPFIRSIGSGQQELEFNTGGNEAARFTSAGNLKFPSGQGIDFSATSDATGMSSELLDDYEEGDFTITLANSVTITTQTQARYVKIGRIVHVTGQFRINSDNSNAALVMNNLPFVSLNTGSNDGGFSPGAIRLYQYPDPGGYGNYISLVQKNDTNLYFYYSRASNTDAQILAYSNGYVAFSCTYHTAA